MNSLSGTVIVTGAFSYTGQYIARRFLAKGGQVLTLTRRPDRPHALQGSVPAFPLDFSKPAELIKTLSQAEILVNTYWVRYNYPGSSFADAVANTKILLDCALKAGIRRLVHISVSKPENSNLAYFRGKWEVEKLIRASGLSHAILRPTITFGHEEVLINNIAWLLRHSPFFAVPGDGQYRLQPVYVEDLAELAFQQAARDDNTTMDAAGPEIYTFVELLEFLKTVVGSRTILVRTPPEISLGLSRLVGSVLGDRLLTREELSALMQDLLVVGQPAFGSTLFSQWTSARAATLGARYTNELKLHHGKGRRANG